MQKEGNRRNDGTRKNRKKERNIGKRKKPLQTRHCKLDASTFFVLPTSPGCRIIQIQSQLPLGKRFVERGKDGASGKPGRTDDGNTETTTGDEWTMADTNRLVDASIHGNRIREG